MKNLFFNLISLFMAFACRNSANTGNTGNTTTTGTIVGLADSTLAIEIPKLEEDTFITYIVDPKTQNLKMYWKDEQKLAFGSILNLKTYLEANNQDLVFATNGGMYMSDCRPLGLYIQDGKTLVPINKRSAPNANFYAKPNGIFYVDSANIATICKTEDFVADKKIKFATQSGPMLLIDGEMHPICKAGSTSSTIRNGVGILPDNRIIFVLATQDINFYDFANYFKKAGCKNALFLDGGISRMYLPEKNWTDLDGNFGAIIAVTAKKDK